MNCPVDQTPLTMSERQGIEIDYCPTCRGIWLDRGELDKIIERAEREYVPAEEPSRYAGGGYSSGGHHGGGGHHGKRRRGLLGELFD